MHTEEVVVCQQIYAMPNSTRNISSDFNICSSKTVFRQIAKFSDYLTHCLVRLGFPIRNEITQDY